MSYSSTSYSDPGPLLPGMGNPFYWGGGWGYRGKCGDTHVKKHGIANEGMKGFRFAQNGTADARTAFHGRQSLACTTTTAARPHETRATKARKVPFDPGLPNKCVQGPQIASLCLLGAASRTCIFLWYFRPTSHSPTSQCRCCFSPSICHSQVTPTEGLYQLDAAAGTEKSPIARSQVGPVQRP